MPEHTVPLPQVPLNLSESCRGDSINSVCIPLHFPAMPQGTLSPPDFHGVNVRENCQLVAVVESEGL